MAATMPRPPVLCGVLVASAPKLSSRLQVQEAVEQVIDYTRRTAILDVANGEQLVVVARRTLEAGVALDDQRLAVRAHIVGDCLAVEVPYKVCPPSLSNAVHRLLLVCC